MARSEGDARMSQPGTLAAALAFVPNWWQETGDPFAIDSLLTGWSKACSWSQWPVAGWEFWKTRS